MYQQILQFIYAPKYTRIIN